MLALHELLYPFVWVVARHSCGGQVIEDKRRILSRSRHLHLPTHA